MENQTFLNLSKTIYKLLVPTIKKEYVDQNLTFELPKYIAKIATIKINQLLIQKLSNIHTVPYDVFIKLLFITYFTKYQNYELHIQNEVKVVLNDIFIVESLHNFFSEQMYNNINESQKGHIWIAHRSTSVRNMESSKNIMLNFPTW